MTAFVITAQTKRLATVRAQLAIAGFTVVDGTEVGWTVTRWGRTRYCATLEGLEAFAQKVGAA